MPESVPIVWRALAFLYAFDLLELDGTGSASGGR
jgi:hypothetical protein